MMHLHFISVPDMFFLCCISLRFFSANSCACVAANRHGGESFLSVEGQLHSLARSLALSLHTPHGRGAERGERDEKTSADRFRANRERKKEKKEGSRKSESERDLDVRAITAAESGSMQ